MVLEEMSKATLLSWQNFNHHISNTLEALYTDKSFADVTLISDDHIQTSAHKFVLSACSPILKSLLINSPDSHPFLYLPGVRQQELQSVLQFIYCGKVQVNQKSINKFLVLARLFQVIDFIQEDIVNECFRFKTTEADIIRKTEFNTELETISEVSNLDIEGNVNSYDVDVQIDSSIKLHRCQTCETVFKSKRSLMRHNVSTHEGVLNILVTNVIIRRHGRTI